MNLDVGSCDHNQSGPWIFRGVQGYVSVPLVYAQLGRHSRWQPSHAIGDHVLHGLIGDHVLQVVGKLAPGHVLVDVVEATIDGKDLVPRLGRSRRPRLYRFALGASVFLLGLI